MKTTIQGWLTGAAILFGVASSNVVRGDGDSAVVSGWGRYAGEYPAYHSKWMAALNEGTNAFLKQVAAPSPRIEDREKMVSRPLRDAYLHAGLSPWLAFVEDEKTAVPVAPGGKVYFTMRTTFSAVLGDRGRTASITDFAIRPSMPYLLAADTKGWMPGRTKAGAPTISGWIDQSVWIKVPADAKPGRRPFTAYALTHGSQNGTLENRQQKQSYLLQIVAAPVPTRANALCVWAYGIRQGEWLARNEGGSQRMQAVHAHQLSWADELLSGFGKVDALARLVEGLRAHPQYESAVLARLTPVGEEE